MNQYSVDIFQQINAKIIEFENLAKTCGFSLDSNLEYTVGRIDDSNGLATLTRLFNESSFNSLLENIDSIIDITASIFAIISSSDELDEVFHLGSPPISHNNKDTTQSCLVFIGETKRTIQPYIEQSKQQQNLQRFHKAVDNKKIELGAGFYYEFTEGDIKRIQTLVNELREQISNSTLFEDDHKNRLLKRLETLQSEMHKKMSDVDKLWGLVGDAGIALGKFGKDAKPLVDRVKELTQITWRTQSRAEELPSGSSNPMIEDNQI